MTNQILPNQHCCTNFFPASHVHQNSSVNSLKHGRILTVKPIVTVTCFVVMALTVFFCSSAMALTNNLPYDLSELSLEDLMNIEVTSVSKEPQKLSDSAAAIFVITQEDIRRSGATSIPEVLRLAPGVHVARIDTSKWSISIRGFNSRFSNKLLVLIDGRSVYSPLYSGVYWDVQDTMLEDIERIEVIRGPGATLWGANAVNGVINIITGNSFDTQGTLISAGTGNQEKMFTNGRYGGAINDKTSYRIYGKYFDRDKSTADDHRAEDGWDSRRGGFRLDSRLTAADSLTIQGDIYDNEADQTTSVSMMQTPYRKTFAETTDQSGGNLLLRWQRTFSDTTGLELQAYYDQTERHEYVLDQELDIYDFTLQNHFQLSRAQHVIWGMDYRFCRGDVTGNQGIRMRHSHCSKELFSTFIQDDIAVIPQQLHLILGSKFEHNGFTGYEVQPNARLLWTPNENHVCWAAFSRAVRTPGRIERDGHVQIIIPPQGGMPEPTIMQLEGTEDYDAEDLLAYELGYRFLGIDNFSVDIAAYYSDYDNLETIETQNSPPNIIKTLDNLMSGAAYGLEAAVEWQPLAWWRLTAVYAYENVSLELNDGSRDYSSLSAAEKDTPHNLASLRSSMDLPADMELDIWCRYVDALKEHKVDSYINMDIRLAWQARPGLEISLVGRNILDSEQMEYNRSSMGNKPTEVPRSLYFKTTWNL